MPGAIEEVPCTLAEKFLSVFDRGNPLWGDTMQFWAFRGHSDDTNYKLIPAALRSAPNAAELGYTHNPKKGLQATNMKQMDAEFQRLQEFFWTVESQGLEIPSDSSLLRTPAGWRDLKGRFKSMGGRLTTYSRW